MRRLSLPLIMALAFLAGCATGPTDPPIAGKVEGLPRQLSATETLLINAGNDFAFSLLRAVNDEEEAEKNLFLSPLSASMALGMTLNGAHGETFSAMQSALGFGGLELRQINSSYRTLIDLLIDLDPAVGVGIANSIWHDQRVTPEAEFLATVRDAFDSQIGALDFNAPGSVDTINSWVDQATKGRIPTILDEIQPDEIMYLINAIHFKAPWTQRFEKKNTRDAPFILADGSERLVPMMANSRADFSLLHENGVTVAEMPYGGGAYSMMIALPDRERTVDHLIATLDASTWAGWVERMVEGRQRPLELPRFRIEYQASLEKALSTIGMGVAFSERADFSRIFADGGVSLSRVVQKTFVEVNEEGTEAAAATAVGVELTSAPAGFTVDRPFVFAIRERLSGAILFIGKVVDPTAG